MRELTAKDKAFLREKVKLQKQASIERDKRLAAEREIEELKRQKEELFERLREFEHYHNIDSDKLHEHMERTKKIESFLRLCEYINSY